MVTTFLIVTKTLSFIISTASILFNAIGIYLLKKTRHFCPGQTVIILNLSATELFIAVGYVIQDAFTLKGNNYKEYFNATFAHLVWSSRSGAYTVWYLVMLLLTTDRFLACNFPVKHRNFATRQNIKITLTVFWLAGIANGIILCVDFHLFHNAYTKFVWLALDSFVLAIILIAYSSIFVHRISRKRISPCQNAIRFMTIPRISTMHQQFVKAVGLIVFTFLLFEIAPTVAYLVLFKLTSNGSEFALSIIFLSYEFVILSDPLIYIFMQDRIRRKFILEARKIFQCNSEVGGIGMAVIRGKKRAALPEVKAN